MLFPGCCAFFFLVKKRKEERELKKNFRERITVGHWKQIALTGPLLSIKHYRKR
jgi:hypothetical protein